MTTPVFASTSRCSIVASAPAPAHPASRDSFFRELKICPDESCLLATAENRSLSLYSLEPTSKDPNGKGKQRLTAAWRHKPADSILSTEWFPGASSSNPAMFAFAVAVKDHPIHLLDGNDQRVRASYPIVNHTERFVAPHSMVFSHDGSRLYGGFENAIEVLDVSTPGAEGNRLATSPNRSSKDGQKGIISTLALRPDHSGLLAAGSFSGSVGFYDPLVGESGVMVALLPSTEHSSGGVTKIAFHPEANLLYSASRHSTALEVWDVRNVTERFATIPRSAKTNMRIGFDVDKTGSWLAVGDADGIVSIWDATFSTGNSVPTASFKVSQDAIGSTYFVDDGKQIVTCSGSRKYIVKIDNDSDDESDQEEEDVEEAPQEDSLKLWGIESD